MTKVPFWTIYSYWSFAMIALWSRGRLPFSPLVSAIVAFVASIFMMRKFNSASIFIIVTHLFPLWVLRNTELDIIPNLKVFLVYNIFLFALGTNFVEVYTAIYNNPPTTIKEYLSQRFLV